MIAAQTGGAPQPLQASGTLKRWMSLERILYGLLELRHHAGTHDRLVLARPHPEKRHFGDLELLALAELEQRNVGEGRTPSHRPPRRRYQLEELRGAVRVHVRHDRRDGRMLAKRAQGQ